MSTPLPMPPKNRPTRRPPGPQWTFWHVLIPFLLFLLFALAYILVVPMLIQSEPRLAFLNLIFEAAIHLAILFAAIAFLYAALFSPDSTIDQFRRPALLAPADSVRRSATRATFALIGSALLVLSLTLIARLFGLEW